MATSRSRRWWVAGGWALATAAALLSAYTVALARLPQQRAAIESLVRSQTGYDLRFGRIAVRLGFYGPEAHFTDVQMWRPGGERRLLQASEMIVRFETWRLLRSGSLQPGRILLVGAQIDAQALRPSQRAAQALAVAAVAQAPEQRLLHQLVEFARALPAGRIELESATLRGFERDASGGLTGRPVRIPRLSIQRTAHGARLQGNALLAERLGRSLFLAFELRGLDAGPRALEGSLALQGRALRLAGWRAAFGGSPDGASGVGDLRATLRLRGGRILAGTLAMAASELRLPRAGGAGQARFIRVSANAGFERLAGGWRLRGSDLRVVVPSGAPAASLDFELDVDSAWSRAQFSADRVPLGWLRPLLVLPRALDIDGTLRALRLTTFTTPQGRSLRYQARVEEGVWRDAGGQPRLEPLALDVSGSENGALVTFQDRPLRLLLDDAPGQARRLEIGLQGSASLRREGSGWRFDSRSLLVLDRAGPTPRPRFELRGTLTSAAPDTATVALEVALLEPVASDELTPLRELSERMLAATPIESFRLAAGRFALDAASRPREGWRIERSQGDLAVSAASFRPDADWPAVSEAGGRLVWGERELRFDFERGSIGALRLVRGQLRRGDAPAWSLVAEGPAAAALSALAASPLATRVPAELRTAAVDGEARFELEVASRSESGSAGAGRIGPPRWRLLARFDSLRWHALADVPPIEDLSGTLRIVDGRLERSNLEGRWLEQPLRIAVDERRAGRRWLLSGRLPDGALRELLAEAYGLDPAAAPRWRLDVQPRSTEASRWRVDLALEGLPARGQFELEAIEKGFELRRGVLRLGAGGLGPPEADTVTVSGDVRALELALLARAWAAVGSRRVAAPALSGSLHVARLDLLGEPLGPVSIGFASRDGIPTLALNGARVSGVLLAADPRAADSGPPQLALARLALERLPGRAALAASARESPWTLDLQVADLSLGARRLGAWRGRLESSRERLAVESMSLEAGEVVAQGRLECLRGALRCALEARIGGGAARTTLDLWGLQTGLDAARLEGTLQLAWPVAAADDAWAALDGALRLTASDGVLEAPVRLGLLPGASASTWSWERLEVDARIGHGRAELMRIAFEGEQRLLLAGTVELPSTRARLDGEWWSRRELPRAIQDWPAAPALAALWRAVRGPGTLPRAVRVTGTAGALDLELMPLQSPAPP